jgi:ribosomal protein S18 acetylase RimI-like enzyme
MKHKYREIFRFSIHTWAPITAYIVSKIFHEVFGGKWGNSEVGQYRSCIELRAIATASDHRRAHVGSNLLQYCIGLARQANKLPIIAWVKEDNEKSINLFVKNGFHKAGVREDKSEAVFLFLLNE